MEVRQHQFHILINLPDCNSGISILFNSANFTSLID